MSIRYKFFFAFSVLVALACALALYGFRGVSESGDRVARLFDGPLIAIEHARSAHAAFNEARVLIQTGGSSDALTTPLQPLGMLLAGVADDLSIVDERVKNTSVASALLRAKARIHDWSEAELSILDPPLAGLTAIPAPFAIERKSDDAVAALDDLVETVAAYGFEYRIAAGNAVAASRQTMLVLSFGAALVGLLLAVSFSYSMSKPILEAWRFAESIAAGNLTNRIEIRRQDELGGLQHSLVAMQSSLKHREDEDQALMERVLFMAHHDQLTGLSNRLQFTHALEDAILRLDDQADAFSVLVLDLNKFKNVNDTLGHPVGDELLKQVADRLRVSVRESDVVARLGGDEFAILQSAVGSKPQDAAIALSLRIQQLFLQPFDLGGNTVNIGTSIGIALAPAHGAVPSDLLRKADLALYEAKSSGHCFTFFAASMLQVVEARRIMEAELRLALARNEMELHYQPVVDARTGLTCAVEALIRWRHPVRGLVPPDQFIPLAEETGLIVSIGEWVLQRACADAARWPENITVAVNVSAVQFKRGDLFDVILDALVKSGLKSSRLELEITETVLLENEQEFLTTIRRLKNIGITIALDDFGTGYSSLSYLTKFPFDRIKIDRSFTQGMGIRSDCDAVISSVLTLARGLSISITAEGVETDEQFALLRNAGVDFLQGYLFGRPVPLGKLQFSMTPRGGSPAGRLLSASVHPQLKALHG
jgi:diguanylate cyclase (GGDEF)-like protein